MLNKKFFISYKFANCVIVTQQIRLYYKATLS